MNQTVASIGRFIWALLSIAFGFALMFLIAVLVKPLLDIGVGLFILVFALGGIWLLFEKLRHRIRSWFN